MRRSYPSLLSWFGLTLAASLMLYHTSDRVTALDRQLRDINTQIESEQESLHVLKAEWVYLSNPARIEAEAKRHLALQPTATDHVVASNDKVLASLLPLRDGVTPGATTQWADAETTAPALPAPAPVAKVAPETTHAEIHAAIQAPRKHGGVFAAINDGRLNDHVVMQHGTVAQASTDTIGGLINSLSLHP